MCGFARAETYVSLHNISSYTRVAMILYMYTCEYMYAYKTIQEVLSSKCECVQGQEHMRYMKCCIEMLYIWVLAVVISRGSNC